MEVIVGQSPLLLLVISNFAVSADDTLYFDKSKPNWETHLIFDDFERARYSRVRLRQHSSHWDDAENTIDGILYRPDRFEGDIVGIDAPHLYQLQSSHQQRGSVFRSAVRNRLQTWPSHRIPYAISTQYSTYSRSRIALALVEYSGKTCIQFVPRTNERDYLFIAPDDGCYSTIGRAGGRQMVSIGSGCVHVGIITHELMHSIGFFHEQSRPDRDEYVIVNWTNVADDMKDQFTKYNYGMIDTMGFDYDYGSIMHYSNRAFTKNGQPTLIPRMDGVRIGQREGFSHLDMTKINALYSCDEVTSDHSAPLEQTTPSVPEVPRSTISEHCDDKMEDCIYRRSLGYCDTLAHWMKEFCKRTCGACIDDEDPAAARRAQI